MLDEEFCIPKCIKNLFYGGKLLLNHLILSEIIVFESPTRSKISTTVFVKHYNSAKNN